MALAKCRECGREISTDAESCPNCGVTNPANRRTTWGLAFVQAVAIILVGSILFSCFFTVNNGGYVATTMQNIENKVATDAINQYDIAKRQGDKIQICVQAGFVAAAFLQAKDEPNYRIWKDTQKADCKKAGMPDL